MTQPRETEWDRQTARQPVLDATAAPAGSYATGPAAGPPAPAAKAPDPVAAFAAVVDRYQTPLLRYVGQLLGSRREEVAQDVVQEAFLRLHRQWQEHGPESVEHLSSWLFRVAHNLARDAGRRSQRQKRLQEAVVQQHMAEQPHQHQPSPAEQLARQEACARAVEELQKLPEHQKQVLLLKVVEGMTLRQICQVTGLTVGNAGYRLNQGLAELSRRLKAAGVI